MFSGVVIFLKDVGMNMQ